MNALPNEPFEDRTPDRGHRFSCRRRVRGTTYVWGNQGGAQGISGGDLHFTSPLILYLRNDIYGETITIETVHADGTSTTIGTLDAGGYISVEIQDMCGVSVSCNLESTVSCVLSGDPGERRFMDVQTEYASTGRGTSTF
jgi:hypothetical protein